MSGKRAASRAPGGANKTQQEVLDEQREDLRVALLSCTNNTNDGMIALGLQHIQTFIQQAIANNPTNVVTNALNTLSIEQLKNISNIAAMGNNPTTIAAFSKAIFATDFNAIQSKIGELNYLKNAQVKTAELAVNTQYYNGTKLDMPKFKEDVMETMTRVAGNAGFASGHAAGQAAAAKAAPKAAPTG